MNKTETRVELLFHVLCAHDFLPPVVARHLAARSPITVRSEQFRDREANKRDCLDKLCGMLRREASGLAPAPTSPEQMAKVEGL